MTVLLIPDPYVVEWQDWADAFIGTSDAYRTWLSADLPWDQFADQLANVMQETPRADLFADWRAWAAALHDVLARIST